MDGASLSGTANTADEGAQIKEERRMGPTLFGKVMVVRQELPVP